MAAKKAKKKPTPAQLAARKKFAAAAKSGKFRKAAKKRKPAKKNTTIIKAKRIDHLDVSKIHSLGKVENPKRRKPNITSASDLQYAGTAKRATQDGVKGWLLGGKFFPGSATTKAHKLTSSAYLDLRTGDVWKRKAKGNPKKSLIGKLFTVKGNRTQFRVVKEYKAAGFIPSITGHTLDGKKQVNARVADVVWVKESRKKNIAGFKDADGNFHPIRSGTEQRTVKGRKKLVKSKKAYKPSKVGEKHTYSAKKSAKRAAQSRRMSAATKARKATTSRLASRALQRSVPLKGKRRNPDTPAQKLQEWRGYPKTGEDTLRFPTGTPSGLYKLGVLKKIILSNGTRITPAAGQAWLCADTNGKLHIGGKTNTAAKGRVVDWPKDNLGKVKQVEYEARKPHLGDNERTIYFHKLGEDDGNKPTLHSDGEGGLLFKGGNYSVTSRGLVN